jgi:hypothetical protein
MKNAFYLLILTGISACPGQQLSGPVADVSPAFARQSIEVITGTDPTFGASLASLLPANIVSELTPLLPYLVIIENHSQVAITRATIRYQRNTSTGRQLNAWVRLDTTSKASALGPGASLIHTPRSDLSQILFAARAGNPPNQGTVAGISAQIFSALFDPRRFTSTVISLDSAIFAGGGIVGPDNWDVMGEAAASATTWASIAAKVNNDSVTDQELNAWLQQQAKQPLASVEQPDGSINHALAAQVALSQGMLSSLSARGRAALKGIVVNSGPQFFRLDQ